MIVMMDASDNYQKKVNVANTYFGLHKNPNPCCQGYSAIIKNYCHKVACLATSTGLSIEERDSPKVVALMQVRSLPSLQCIANTSVTRNAHQEKDKDYLMLPIFQKYAVPYTESSPRRVTRKAIASCTFVLASDPGDLQRCFAFFLRFK